MLAPILVVVTHLALSAFGTPQAASQPPTIREQAEAAQLPLPEGVFRPGGSVTFPEVVKEVRPQYTSDSMRAKILGTLLDDFFENGLGFRRLTQLVIDAA